MACVSHPRIPHHVLLGLRPRGHPLKSLPLVIPRMLSTISGYSGRNEQTQEGLQGPHQTWGCHTHPLSGSAGSSPSLFLPTTLLLLIPALLIHPSFLTSLHAPKNKATRESRYARHVFFFRAFTVVNPGILVHQW